MNARGAREARIGDMAARLHSEWCLACGDDLDLHKVSVVVRYVSGSAELQLTAIAVSSSDPTSSTHAGVWLDDWNQ